MIFSLPFSFEKPSTEMVRGKNDIKDYFVELIILLVSK